MRTSLALICSLALACAAGGQVTSTGGGGGGGAQEATKSKKQHATRTSGVHLRLPQHTNLDGAAIRNNQKGTHTGAVTEYGVTDKGAHGSQKTRGAINPNRVTYSAEQIGSKATQSSPVTITTKPRRSGADFNTDTSSLGQIDSSQGQGKPAGGKTKGAKVSPTSGGKYKGTPHSARMDGDTRIYDGQDFTISPVPPSAAERGQQKPAGGKKTGAKVSPTPRPR
jgi:hypothetical protein